MARQAQGWRCFHQEEVTKVKRFTTDSAVTNFADSAFGDGFGLGLGLVFCGAFAASQEMKCLITSFAFKTRVVICT